MTTPITSITVTAEGYKGHLLFESGITISTRSSKASFIDCEKDLQELYNSWVSQRQAIESAVVFGWNEYNVTRVLK
jgi:hypothetical protein